jgi:hypothetical protein
VNLYPHEPLPAREVVPPDPPELSLYARVEGLIGEEDALLKLPADETTPAQRERLRGLQEELDGLWAQLRERARRLAAAGS